MKVTILAAAGQIGELVTADLLNDTTDELTLVARDAPARLANFTDPRVTLVDLDLLETSQLAAVLHGQDLVILAVTPDQDVADSVINAMDTAGVRRIIVAGAIGVEDEVPGKFGEWNRKMSGGLIAPFIQGFHALENSDLDYTYVRMTWLYNDPQKTDYVITQPGEPQAGVQISRSAVANFITQLVQAGATDYQRASIGIYEPGSDRYDHPTFY
ncbi:NAD(P)H-binding protein [Fructilactobacillus myrtifloralis]|uniref:NAD(P)H-binding protein n=1 Tax=Fructilactobacillus myrtifloralis TaxID=2940301 RepID=A0ABY5BP00_9LACO|nr:NAD(P)H-binding protein [Fructilactobacillus myrtifloralis]USS84817.1 NAD(P)H-binding protein [Fructilactobacillus myrtifloralis]